MPEMKADVAASLYPVLHSGLGSRAETWSSVKTTRTDSHALSRTPRSRHGHTGHDHSTVLQQYYENADGEDVMVVNAVGHRPHEQRLYATVSGGSIR